MTASLPVWELEPWRFADLATSSEAQDLRARAADLAAEGHVLGEEVHVSRLAVVDCAHLELGDRTYVAAFAHLSGDVRLGDDCSVNTGVAVRGSVRAGRAVRIGAYTTVLGFDHRFDDVRTETYRQPLQSRGIGIGDDVWIGAHVVVRDGVHIGSHVVIGAGTVVTRDVPDWAVVVGNPGRVVRDRRSTVNAVPPAPLTDLGRRFRTSIETIVDQAFVDGWYRDHLGAPRTVRAHTDAIELADLALGAPPAQLSRSEHVTRLSCLQDSATGLVAEYDAPPRSTDGLPDQVRAYHVLAVGYALRLLGSQFPHPVNAVTAVPPSALVAELDHLEWKSSAWGAGALADAVGTALTWAQLRDPHSTAGAIEAVVGWVTTRQDPGTGLWGSTAGGLLEPVNGAFRLLRGTLAQWGVGVPRPRELVDSVLRRAEELDDRSSACDVLDVIWLLWFARRTVPTYRVQDGTACAATVVRRAAAAWIDGHGWPFQPGDVPSLRGTHLWSSTVWYAADLLGRPNELGYRPRGVHSPRPLVGLDRLDDVDLAGAPSSSRARA